MKLTAGLNLKCWAIGVTVTDKIPLAGYIDGVEYMAAVENRLIVLFIGPFAIRLWIGPQPKETP